MSLRLLIQLFACAPALLSAPLIYAQGAFDFATFNNTKKTELALLRITPHGFDVPTSNRQIVFKFDQPVVAVGDMQREAKDIPITISPSVNCQWLWLDTSSLSCQIDRADTLSKATRYSVVIQPGITTTQGAGMSEPMTHTFVTERPKLAYVRLHEWADAARPVVDLRFNQPVTRSSLERRVNFKINGAQSIPISVDQKFNPLYESHYQQPTPGAEFTLLPSLAYDPDLEQQEPTVAQELERRGQALEVARLHWRITPATDLPADTSITISVDAGIESVFGVERGVADSDAHTFRSLPEFRFLGIQCFSASSRELVDIAPKYSSSMSLRDPQSGQKLHSDSHECEPLHQASLKFSTPVSYETAKHHLTVTPDLAGGIKDYDPWAARYDQYQLTRFFRNRFNHGNNAPYLLVLPEVLKAFDQYSLNSDTELVDEVGRTLSAPVDMGFLTAHRAPSLVYSHRYSVLEKGVDSEVPVTVTNLDTFKVEQYSKTTVNARISGLDYARPLPDVEDIAYAIPLGVRELLDGKSGAVVGHLASDPVPERYHGDYYTFFSQVTPFQVHLKFGHFLSYAWVTDMATGEPVADASVRLELDQYASIDPMSDIDGAAKTDRNGVVMLPGFAELDPRFDYINAYRFTDTRFMVKVVKGSDMAILPVDNGYAAWSEIGHHKRFKNAYTHAWGTTAQGVYKAGDTIQYKIYVRNQDNKHWVAPAQGKYSLSIIDPKGQTVANVDNVELSEFGAFHGDFKISDAAAVGWYQFVINFKDDQHEFTLYPMQVLVSDFTPAAFRVSNELNGDQFQSGDQIVVTSLAKMHAGGPYADAEARVTAMLQPKRFASTHPIAKGFVFDYQSQASGRQTVHQSVSNVGQDGDLQTTFTMPDSNAHFGRLVVESAVRDDRGKYIASSTSADYVGRDRFVGLKNTRWVHEAGKPASVQVVVVDSHGEPVSGDQVTLDIERQVTRAARVKGAGNAYVTQYSSEWVRIPGCSLESAEQAVTCEFTPEEPGSYRIQAHVKDSKGRANQAMLHTWVVGEGNVTWQGPNNHRLEIIADAESYAIGDTAKFLIKNPYPGAEALITVERYGVLRHWQKTLNGSTPIIEIPILDDDYPGVFVSVIVTSPRVAQPLGEGNVDLGKPAFKMGYAKLPVRDNNKELEVTVRTDKDTYKPRDTVSVRMKAKPRSGKKGPMEVAVVVIDEAVFDLNRHGRNYYDPHHGFNKLEELGVGNYNTLMRLVGRQKFEKKGANPGGGGGADDATELRNLIKFVAYWNPSIELDKRGRGSFEFELPDNLTGWRVFAMAVSKEERMGLGDASFKVNRPTELRPVMPNQLTEGDEVQSGFSVMNRTDKARTLTVTMKVAGDALSQPISKTVRLELAAYQRKTVWMPVKTSRFGELAFYAKAADELDSDALEHHVAVNKRRSLVAAATYGTTTQASVSEQFEFPEGIYQDVGGLSVDLSPTVIGNITGAFRYLRDYPYACWEQRLSKGLAAAQYVRLKGYLPDELVWDNSAELVATTLDNAAAFQAPNGGMTYWVNRSDYVSPYLSAYTALGFTWLRDMGYEIPERVEENLHRYLKDYLRREESNRAQAHNRVGLRSSIRAVALAALAARGKISKSDLNRYKPQLPQMDLFGKAHFIQAATSLDMDDETLLELSNSLLSYSVQSGGKVQFNEETLLGSEAMLHTPMRSNCAILSSLLNVAGNSTSVQKVVGDIPFKQVRAITQTRGRRDHWENTQENIYCLNALVNFSRVYENEPPNMVVEAIMQTEKYGEQGVGKASFNDLRDPSQRLENKSLAVEPNLAGRVDINKQGPGRVYYAVRLSYAKTEDNANRINAGIEVKREYSVQRDGQWVLIENPMQLAKGELVRVDLYVSTATARHFVVIDDPVPGGLETVNRDLATASEVDAAQARPLSANSWWHQYPSWTGYGHYGLSFYHKELRHDAARFFSDYLPAGNYHLSYTAQAIAGGTFSVMPVKAEEMYDPDVYGLGLPTTLGVEYAKEPQ